MDKDCIFCKIIAGEIPAEKVYEDDYAVAFMDIQPINPGHVLVVPKAHSADLTEMSGEAVGWLFRLVRHVAIHVRDAVGAPGFNIGVNTGGAAGQLVYHTHIHVMPRFENDGHRHWQKKPMSAEEIAAAAEKIRGSLGAAGSREQGANKEGAYEKDTHYGRPPFAEASGDKDMPRTRRERNFVMMHMRKILVTGGAGFIGSAFVRYMLRAHPDLEVVNYDVLSYAGNLENLKEIEGDARYRFVKGDIGDLDAAIAALDGVDAVVNFAAETHNDRSVLDPGIFVRTNVLGTQMLLEACRRAEVARFHHISTDEVYGDLGLDEDRAFKEGDVYLPRSPYSASKAASDHIVRAYHHTFGLETTISNCANNYGPYQFPEKLIPLFATNALEDKPLPLFKSSRNTREYIHCDDHSSAVDLILREGKPGETYNIGTGIEKSVEEITDLILATLGKPASLKTYVPDRPGLDRRYLLDSSKIRQELGWEPKVGFEEGMRETILWYRDNPEWWKRVKSGAYQEYYEKYYTETLGANA